MVTADTDRAKKLVLEGRCIAFLGAGISYPPAPLWAELVDQMVTRCGISERSGTLPEVVDRCIGKDREECNRTLRDELPKYSPILRTAVTSMMRLPFRAILTTNVDPWVRQQTIAERHRACFVYPDLPLGDGIGNRKLYYLHGLFDSDDKDSCITKLVFGESSYEEAYEESLLGGFLLNAFTYENVLFVGFNPRERWLTSLLRRSRQIQVKISAARGLAQDRKKFIFYPAPDSSVQAEHARQIAEIAELEALGLVPVFFDKGDNLWKGLDRMLTTWVEEGDAKNRPAPMKSGFEV